MSIIGKTTPIAWKSAKNYTRCHMVLYRQHLGELYLGQKCAKNADFKVPLAKYTNNWKLDNKFVLCYYKVVPLIKLYILRQIPAFYDIPSQRYKFIQIVPNYPIIPISVQSKGLATKSSSTKLFYSSKYT